MDFLFFSLIIISLSLAMHFYRRASEKGGSKGVYTEVMKTARKEDPKLVVFISLGFGVVIFILTSLFHITAKYVRYSTLGVTDTTPYFHWDSSFMILGFFFLSIIIPAYPWEKIIFRRWPDERSEKQHQVNLFQLKMAIIITALIFTPVWANTFDHYSLITDEEIIINPLYSIGIEEKYLLEESSLQIRGYLRKRTMRLEATVLIPTGTSKLFDVMCSPYPEDEIKVIKELKNKITIDITEMPSPEDFSYVASIKVEEHGKYARDFDGPKKAKEAEIVFREVIEIVE